MIIIKHRVNSINELKKISPKYGVEIDLRSNNNNIYLHHDPFKKGVLFKNWIKFYKHKIIVLNVKEEGLEKKILQILKKNKIKRFFFHDQTFSSLLKNLNKTKVSIRFSEYEDLKNKNYLFSKPNWLWLDNFTKIEMNKKFYNFLLKKKIKICLVSPELVKKKRKKELSRTYFNLKKNKILPHAVCTKYPLNWEKIIKY